MDPRSPARPFVALGFVLIVCAYSLTGRAAAQVQYRKVALSGQAAPGTPAGVNYSDFDAPALNDAGQVAYFATLTGSGTTGESNEALYAGLLAAPQLVARGGNAAPGTPAGVNYASFLHSPALNDAAEVAYFVGLTGRGVTTENDFAIYAGSLAAPQLVARDGNAAPGTPAGVNYSVFSSPALNDAGQVAFSAILAGSGVTNTNNETIYAGPLAAPQLVAREGDPAPGTPPGVNYSFFAGPALNNAGQVAYYVFLTGSGVTPANDRAFYAGPLAAPQLLARSGNAAPGTSAGVNYAGFFETPTLNDAGQAAYIGRLTGSGVTTVNDRAIYAGPLAAPQLVVREGDAAPGTPAGVSYSEFDLPALNDAGQVAYFATLTGSGVTLANDSALYAGPFAAPQLVVREGDAAPGTSAGVNYSTFVGRTLNDAGQVAYVAFLTGSDVTTANDRGLFVSDPALGGLLVARERDLFDVGGANFRTVANNGINFIGGLSNNGTLAFRLGFTDGTSGIFTATIVPEPAALPLLAVAALSLAGCRSPRGRRLW